MVRVAGSNKGLGVHLGLLAFQHPSPVGVIMDKFVRLWGGEGGGVGGAGGGGGWGAGAPLDVASG